MIRGSKFASFNSAGDAKSTSTEFHTVKGSFRELNDDNNWPEAEKKPYRTMSFMDKKGGCENDEPAEQEDDFSFLPHPHNNLILDPGDPGNTILEEQTGEDESS